MFPTKQDRYEELLIAMITDQWDWIKDRKHIRIIDEAMRYESLRMAEAGNSASAQKI